MLLRCWLFVRCSVVDFAVWSVFDAVCLSCLRLAGFVGLGCCGWCFFVLSFLLVFGVLGWYFVYMLGVAFRLGLGACWFTSIFA